ncbi:MAG: hypothetical protein L3J51_12910 [Cocleimonas sp.]|nr:hypothetical protein [Cocleimonas sp.]
MNDLFTSGNGIGGSGPGGAGSSGRGAGGVGEYGKGAGGVGEYGSGAGGSGAFGSGAGGSGVGVNYDAKSNYRKSDSRGSLWEAPEASYNNEIINGEVKRSRQQQSEYKAVQAKKYSITNSPITCFMLNLLYPIIYIPLVLLVINISIVFIGSIATGNALGMPFMWIIRELLGISMVAYFHHLLIRKLRNKAN